ncbi:inducible alternative oxidase 2 [Dispira simplex]|nr:inducible alternative oxidase 2 [Dispira simplex]
MLMSVSAPRRTISFFSAWKEPATAKPENTLDDPPSLQLHKERLRRRTKEPIPGVNRPEELKHLHVPEPIRHEFMVDHPLKTSDLESLDIYPTAHREPGSISDRIALATVKLLRKPTDWFFKKKYVHRAVMLETVAAVPGMVGAMLRHLKSLRLMQHDGGWISHLLHEAENERMHLMTWMRLCQPNLFDRVLVCSVQFVFFDLFFLFYLASPRTAHRLVGYLEEEAIISYTAFLKEIDEGRIPNVKAPEIAVKYWNLDPATATLRDVVLAVRADEALHRDVNHYFSDRLLLKKEDLHQDLHTADWKSNQAHRKLQMPHTTQDADKVFHKSAATSSYH